MQSSSDQVHEVHGIGHTLNQTLPKIPKIPNLDSELDHTLGVVQCSSGLDPSIPSRDHSHLDNGSSD